jgi:hypothetical protein
MNKTLQAICLSALCLLTGFANAANKFVRPDATGRNDGSDWSNAYTALPSSLARGDTYYLADGNYGSRTFADANSGTAVITVKKATDADHGIDGGWSSSYGDGQAVFSEWYIYTDYYVFDGQRRNANWAKGDLSQYGIRISASRGPTIRLDNGSGTGGDNLTFRYIDAEAGGRDTGYGDHVIYGLTGNSNVTFEYCALHDSSGVIFQMRGNWRNLKVDHCYMARNSSTPGAHGELLSMTDSDTVTWSNNIMEDIEGTGFIVGINGGVAQNWRIFGNVFVHSAAYAADTGRKPGHNWGVAGIVFIANDSSNNNTGNNILVYNNTIVNVQGTWSGVVIQRGSGNEVRNNIWYSSTRTNNSGAEISNNWYFNTIQDGDASATKAICSSACDIFSSISGKDFRLKSALGGAMALSAPYNVDTTGAVRGSDGVWDRGAYEFGGTVAAPAPAPVQPPTNVVVR